MSGGRPLRAGVVGFGWMGRVHALELSARDGRWTPTTASTAEPTTQTTTTQGSPR